MSRKIRNIRSFIFLLLIICTGLLSVLNQVIAGTTEPRFTVSAPSERLGQNKERSTSQIYAVCLAPFYLIKEAHKRVWVERVIVTVEVDQPLKSSFELASPTQRALIFDLLSSEKDDGAMQHNVLAALRRMMKEKLVTGVKFSRSLLLL